MHQATYGSGSEIQMQDRSKKNPPKLFMPLASNGICLFPVDEI
jgi:hypothetical protein